jgi:hypothetical protein
MLRNAILLVALLGLGPCLLAEATVLYGTVEHSESVQPIDNDLRPGDIFSRGNVPSRGLSDQNYWYRVPAWLAGVWHKESQTDYYLYNFKTGETDNTRHERVARSDGRWGTQRDASGSIWQLDPVPYSETIDAGSDNVVQIVRVCDPIEVDGNLFGKRTMNMQLRIDKETGQIKQAESGEEITYFSPQADGSIKRETSSKVFDPQGKPILLGKSISYESKIAEFTPQPSYNGKDTQTLLNQFLKSNAMLDLTGTDLCLLTR